MNLERKWTPPEQTQLGTSGRVDDSWWEAFHDPALSRLVAGAAQQNLTLQVAGLRIAEARAQLGVAVARQFPQMQVVFGSITARQFSGNLPIQIGRDRRFIDYQVGFDASWEVDLWGKYRRAVEAEDANVLASVADYDDAVVSLTAEVARTYTAVRTFEVLIEQARENVVIQDQALQIARSRLQHGASSELDEAQALTQLESTRASIPRIETGREQARNALGTLLAQPPATIDELLAGPKEIPNVPPTVTIGMPADLLRRRPDVRSAEHRAAAQVARVGVAKADLYPIFTIAGSIGFLTTSGTNFEPTVGNGLFYSIGPRLEWRGLDYGRTRNLVRTEDSRYQQLLVGYHDAVLRAAQEVEDALAGFLKAQETAELEQRSVTSARRALEIAVIQYREGAVDFVRVLEAQRVLVEQQNALANTRSTAATSLVALYKALGGGWETRDGAPINATTREEMRERTGWSDLLSKPVHRNDNGSSGEGPATGP